MNTALDLYALLHDVVDQAVALLPFATRGSLLVRDGRRLVHRAAVGWYGAPPAARLRIPSDAGAISASPPFGPEALPEAARGPAMVDALAWYRAHLPSAGAPEGIAAGASVLVIPVIAHGDPIGYLALEQADDAPLDDERRARLAALAADAAAALDRARLYNDGAQAAQELHLLEEVLGAVIASVEIHRLVEILGTGLRNVQPGAQWTEVHLAMPEPEAGPGRVGEAGRAVRLYKAPQPMTAYWNNLRDGTLAAGRDLGIAVDFKRGTAEGPTSQQAMIEEGLRAGVDAIAVAPIDAIALEPSIRRAIEAGIPVIAFDSPPAPDSRALVYIGTDNLAAGRLAGEMMVRLLPRGGLVALQVASARTLNARQRVEGFRAAVAGTGIELLPVSENAFDAALGVRLATTALEQRPEIAGVFGGGSENGPCWGLAARAIGRGGDLKIIGFDPVAASLAMLRDGVMHAVIAQREHDMGYRTVHLLHELVTRGVDATLAELPASRVIDTGVDVVTLERTPWSSALSDYLKTSAVRRISTRRSGAGPRGRALRILVVGMAETESRVAEERLAFSSDTLVGQVIGTTRSLVLDPRSSAHDGWADVVQARQSGARTLAGIPLVAGDVLGAIVLSSAQPDACSPEDLAQLERVAGAAAVALANARLVSRLTERTRQLEQLNQHQEALLGTIAELSSPVVPIARGVLVMPLVGIMDAQRSARFIESMLHEITKHRARVVLVDVTGLANLDACAADHLAQAARAAGLLGAEVVLVGISPAAARVMVDQALDLGGVVTHSTLELGFTYALAKTHGEIRYRKQLRWR